MGGTEMATSLRTRRLSLLQSGCGRGSRVLIMDSTSKIFRIGRIYKMRVKIQRQTDSRIDFPIEEDGSQVNLSRVKWLNLSARTLEESTKNRQGKTFTDLQIQDQKFSGSTGILVALRNPAPSERTFVSTKISARRTIVRILARFSLVHFELTT